MILVMTRNDEYVDMFKSGIIEFLLFINIWIVINYGSITDKPEEKSDSEQQPMNWNDDVI